MQPLTAILLDDDASQAYLFARTLEDVEDLDVELVHHRKSEPAMTDPRMQSADLLFLDHFLGEKETGLDLLRSLRSAGHGGAIVMMTGSDEEGIVTKFLESGADAYLCKTHLTPLSLGTTIRIALRLPHRGASQVEAPPRG